MATLDFDHLMAESSPVRGVQSDRVEQEVGALVEASYESSRRPRLFSSNRLAIVIPSVALLGLATTAGAVGFIAGFAADTVIPIAYRTSTGVEVSCTVAVEVLDGQTSAESAALDAFVTTNDWSGIGPLIYDEAIRHPYLPTPADADSLTQANIDQFSFASASLEVMTSVVNPQLAPYDAVAGISSDCTGQLR